ncbi:hypothetical protein SUGI_0500860 [Cryptomeria japonica]|nr:hypothetical protein SUGI_0500860 [Cryptomeria japonica]
MHIISIHPLSFAHTHLQFHSALPLQNFPLSSKGSLKLKNQILTKFHSNEFEDYQNLHNSSRDGLLSDLFSTDDVEDDFVLQVIKNLQEEINGTSEIGKISRLSDQIGERVSSYEDLMNATDDQLGICRSPPLRGK